MLGFDVIYGDTDSVFIKPRNNLIDEDDVLYIIHKVFSFTPLRKTKLEFECFIPHIILLDKKMYYGLCYDYKENPPNRYDQNSVMNFKQLD